jgi:hypothetical protein
LADRGKASAQPLQRARDVLMLEMDKWVVAYLSGRKMLSIPLAKTGDSDRRQMLSEYALEARNEKASGGVFDNTTVPFALDILEEAQQTNCCGA